MGLKSQMACGSPADPAWLTWGDVEGRPGVYQVAGWEDDEVLVVTGSNGTTGECHAIRVTQTIFRAVDTDHLSFRDSRFRKAAFPVTVTLSNEG
jgi:hypothetical protein